MGNRIKQYQEEHTDLLQKEMIDGLKSELDYYSSEVQFYKSEYNRTHSETMLFIIKELRQLTKRLTHDLNRWIGYKDSTLHGRSQTNTV